MTALPLRPKDYPIEKIGGPGEPFIPRPAIDLLAKHLKPHAHVLEWGSGYSTVWFSHHAGAVWSVENDRQIMNAVRELLQKADRWNVFQLFAADQEQYAQIVESLGAFDAVLVDGLNKLTCVGMAKNHVKRGGLLMINHAEAEPFWPGLAADFIGWTAQIIESDVPGYHNLPWRVIVLKKA